jgi:hypothetical protein
MARWAVRQAFVIGVLVACACALAEAPSQFRVVERYAALLSEGDQAGLRSLFAPSAVVAEYDLFWAVEVNPAIGEVVSSRVRAMASAGVRLEVELAAVEGDGAVLVTRERMWGESVPEVLAPLRATAVYVVLGERIVSITRVLDADQRGEMVREAVIGTWGPSAAMRFEADGTYRFAHSVAGLDERAWDSGSYRVEGGGITFVSGADTYSCRPGDVGSWWLRFDAEDWLAIGGIEEGCSARGRYASPTIGLRFERVKD